MGHDNFLTQTEFIVQENDMDHTIYLCRNFIKKLLNNVLLLSYIDN